METENIIYENDNLEVTSEAETNKNDISIKKGLFLLIPAILSAIIFLVCALIVAFTADSVIYYLSAELPGQLAYAIQCLLNIIPYIVTPLVYIVWLLISSRFINFAGGKKIFILSGLGGYVLGSATIGLIMELLCFALSVLFANISEDYLRYTNIALLFVRCLIVLFFIFAFSMLIYAIVCKKNQKKLSEKQKLVHFGDSNERKVS